ncbi:hypothetical protein PR202_gb17699 [Eleusine coracana subsp. coracana]|uniref:Uncharacterized protein n=1 Tax=Eleusine coracana subsp. coracana TaxID=191504 RepID=A0AAV5F1A1_ELECO|nr:hypothetical protein PR202_gb17699 [Eleusine coracana subsp. coracana]
MDSATGTGSGAVRRRVRIAVVGDVVPSFSLLKPLHSPPRLSVSGTLEIVRLDDWVMHRTTIGPLRKIQRHSNFFRKVDRVRLQLGSLGEQHVGYKCLDFPRIKISIVGGRPFSCGGDRLFRPKLLSKCYGVNDMAASAKKICDAAAVAPEGYFVVLLAHNGPTGLGSRIDDICGRDWVPGGGDHGDPGVVFMIALPL